MLNKSFTVTADIEVPEAGAEGMIFTHGGLTGGFGIYLREGKANFVYNMLAIERFTITVRSPAQGENLARSERPIRGQNRRAR